MAELITVLGARGFIGSHLIRRLQAEGVPHLAPARAEDLRGRDLGRIIDCIGLTANFRQRLFDTVDGHIGHLLPILREATFESFVYLSSTRVYKYAVATDETLPLMVTPSDPDDLYNSSKLMGEAVVLAAGGQVARLSNVYGQDFRSSNFLTSLIGDAVDTGHVTLRTSLESAKDYVHVDQVVSALLDIARKGRQRIYNVASGRSTTHRAIMERLCASTGCTVDVVQDAPCMTFPPITIARLQSEFPFAPVSVLDDVNWLVDAFRARGVQR